MKPFIAIVLSALLLLSATGCSQKTDSADASNTLLSDNSVDDVKSLSSAEPTSDVKNSSSDISSAFSGFLQSNQFKGVAYAVKNGKPLVFFADGTLENGKPYTVDTPVPIGSVSKQFCAAAILLLQEQGKLNISDTLDKFYPDYAEASKITLKDLLCMRSGIPDISEEIYSIVSVDNTEEQNAVLLKQYYLSKPLLFEPDTDYAYSNTNYFLLGEIVEQISGEKYIYFLRNNIFTPLGMKHTGSIEEMVASAEWTNGVSYQQIDLQPGITKGAGDIISTGEDMTLWLTALFGGKLLSDESLRVMTDNYSYDHPEGNGYGFGIRCEFFGGFGHPGSIGNYLAVDFYDPDQKLAIFFGANTNNAAYINKLLPDLYRICTE